MRSPSISLSTSILCFTILVATTISCSSSDPDPDADCSTSPATFTQANAVIQANCTNSGCHSAGSANGPGPLTNYTQIFAAKTSIRSAVSSGSMPKNGSLSDAQKKAILCWIDAGAPNN